jgi:hypothetical protein
MIAVEGNPLHDMTLLQDAERIKLVLKGGTCCLDRRVEQLVP